MDDEGLSFLDRVWEAAPFADHSRFLRQVREVAGQWRAAGRLTQDERQAILTAAAQAEDSPRR